MVRAKMEQKEYIILCLEDTNDWSNATTRRLVMQVLPAHPLADTDHYVVLCASHRSFVIGLLA